jgi:hypothetical protein
MELNFHALIVIVTNLNNFFYLNNNAYLAVELVIMKIVTISIHKNVINALIDANNVTQQLSV